MREKGIETAKPIHPASWFIADLLSQARSRADDGLWGSYPSKRDRTITSDDSPGIIAFWYLVSYLAGFSVAYSRSFWSLLAPKC